MEPASMSGGVSSVMGSGGVGGMVPRFLQQSDNEQIGSDILMATNIKITVLWTLRSCNNVDNLQYFRGIYSLHLQVSVISFITLSLYSMEWQDVL
jgi:hypothetical protein